LRNILLSELNFASAMAAAAQRIVVMTSPRFTALSFLGDGRRPFLEGYISNAIRASLSYAPLLAEHRSCRPDPFLTLDLVTQTSNSDLFEVSPPDASWTQGAAAAIPVLACSVKIANIMCLPGACLVIAVDLSEPASSLSRFGRLCATVAVPHVVVFSGADSVTRKGMRRQSVDLRALFPMAADVVDVVQCVPTLHSVLGPPRLVPASWLLFHRELLRSDAVVLSWPAVVALARRCGVFDPDHVLGSVQLHAPSVVLPGRFVIASVPRLREVLTPAFDPVPNILWLPERVRRTAASLLTRSLLCGVDIVHIFRHFVERSAILDDDTILTILDLFAYIHSVGSGLFAVRTASQPASNLAVYARLLQHPEMFQMVDARCDRRLHFQHNEIRFIAWVNENSGELIVDSIEATAEQLTAVRSKLIHADMG
jgi:hypothetical protein